MAIESINPATGNLIRRFDPLTPELVHQKIRLAHDAFRTYQFVPLEHRALCMRKLIALLEEDTESLAAIITQEMGKPLEASRQEIRKCAAGCRYYAENAARILAPEAIATDNSHSYVRYDPLGVILAVMPWNFPFWQVFRFLAPALMAGNVGLLKHASNVPQCAIAIESLVRRAGFPRGTFQSLLIESSQVERVLGDDRIAAVTLTGSEPAGRAVAAQAGSLIKKSVLELGGSDPFIVMSSADLDLAVKAAVSSRCVNNGQSCIAAKRFIVAAPIYDAFESRFTAAMQSLHIGDPTHPATDIGPLATHRLRTDLEAQVREAVTAGARILTGGESLPGQGFFYRPTVLTGVPRTSAIFREEFFGPVAMLFRVENLDEAIDLANDTPFGLAASAWTREPNEQQRLVRELEAGAVFLNAMVASDPRLPFGGIKRSGFGRELSTLGMREFLNAKTVYIANPAPANSNDRDNRLELLHFPDPRHPE